MARVLVHSEGLAGLIASFNGVDDRARDLWAKSAYRGGAEIARTIARNQPKRTGALARSYDHAVSVTGKLIRLEVGTIRPGTDKKILAYAATQEFGATIRPKKARYLAIPLLPALTKAGVARGGPRDFQNTFVAKGIIYQKIPGRKFALPLFKLVREVKIKGTGIASKAVLAAHAKMEQAFIADFEAALA